MAPREYYYVEGDDVEGDDDVQGGEYYVEGDDVEGDEVEGDEVEGEAIFDVVAGDDETQGDEVEGDEVGRFLFFGRKKRKASKAPKQKKGRRMVLKKARAPAPASAPRPPPINIINTQPKQRDMSRTPRLNRQEMGPVRDFPLPLSKSSTTAAGATESITVKPQVPLFKPTRLVVDSAVAGAFNITAFYVGNKPQFAATGEVPASAFTETATSGMQGEYDTVHGGLDVTISFRNKSAAAAAFSAVLWGHVGQR